MNSVQIVPSNGDPDGTKFKEYQAMYQYSITRPEEFWAKEAMERLSWVRPFDAIKSGSLEGGDQSWFINGQVNACYNCCDRHDPEKIAITWEGNEVRAQASRGPWCHAGRATPPCTRG